MQICFILIEPAIPENVGAAARAIKTMGFTDLRLVNPCDYLSPKARMLAHASAEILENAKVFSTLEEAIEDLDFTIATSAKKRWVKLDLIPSNNLLSFLNKKGEAVARVGVVFGREESGLTNEEISLCDRVSTVPLNNPYPSINLAQTVMLYAYSLSELAQGNPLHQAEDINPESLKSLQSKVIEVLKLADITPSNLIYGRIMERVTELGVNDIQLLHSVTGRLLKELMNKRI